MVEQPALAIATAEPGSALPLTIFAICEKFSMLRDGVGFSNRAITITPLGYPDGLCGVFVVVRSGARVMSRCRSDAAGSLAGRKVFVTSGHDEASARKSSSVHGHC